MRYIDYAEIAVAVSDDLPIVLTEDELIRIGRQATGLKFIRESSRRSKALWRLDEFEIFLNRRLRHAPELFETIMGRLTGQLPTPAKRKSKDAKL